MKLLALTAAAASPADRFNGYEQANPIEEMFWGLIGLAVTIVIVRTLMRLRRKLPGADAVNAATVPMPDPETVLVLKLGQWRTSALVLITVTALSMTATWFDRISYAFAFDKETFFIDYMAGPLGESLSFYLFSFVPVLVWHLADLIERPRPKSKLVALISSHALMIGVLVTVGLGYFLLISGWAVIQSPCGGLFTLMSQACMGPAPAVMFPVLLLGLALPLISLLKLAVALWSRLGPRT